MLIYVVVVKHLMFWLILFWWSVCEVMTDVSLCDDKCSGVFLFQWRLFQSFSVRDTNGYNPKLIDQLHSWIVAYLTSRMSVYYPVISSDDLLVLLFDCHFRIWWDFLIECFVCLKLFIRMGGGPPTFPCRSYVLHTTTNSFCFYA